MDIMNIISLACLGILVIYFFIGFGRSFKNSFTRFILIAISLVAAIFLSPVLSNFLIKTFVSGYVFNGFGISIDFKELVESNIGSATEATTEILNAQSTEVLVTSVMNLALNIVAFIVIFNALVSLTLIIYWIVRLITKIANRKNAEYKEKQQKQKRFSYRLVGGVFGILSAVVLCFSITIPVFGVMNICDQFLQTEESNAASAYHTQTYSDGELYYKDNEQIGQIETLIEQYANIKQTIADSPVGKIANIVGIDKLSKTTFNYLTTVNSDGLEVSMTNEIVSIIKVYNAYKQGFVENTLDIENQESLAKAIDTVELIYNEANNSSIVKSYLVEFVPKFREKWIAGEKFLGIVFPIEGEYADLAIIVIDKGFNTYNIEEINNNVKSLIGVARVANNSGLIKAIKNETNLLDFIKGDRTNLIKNIIVELSKSKFSDALPEVIQDVVKIAYDVVIDTNNVLTKEEINNIFADVDKSLPDDIDWNNEGQNLQDIIKNALTISDVFYSSDADDKKIIDSLDQIGILIDSARTSVFSNHFKILVNKMINTKIDKDILGADAMDILINKLDANWSNVAFKFADMFNVLKQTALIAEKITINTDNTTDLNDIVDNLESVVGEIIANEQVKDTFVTILEKDVIDKFIPPEHAETVAVVKDMVNEFMDKTTTETLQEDIAAGKEILNIVNNSVNSGTFSLEDDNLTKEQKAEEIVNTLTNSTAVMTVIETAANNSIATNTLANMAQNLGGEDVEILKNTISNLQTASENAEEQAQNEANKEALMKLFGISNS